MDSKHLSQPEGINDLQTLIAELEKGAPDPKVIRPLTSKYGIPYKSDPNEQIHAVLHHLNMMTFSVRTDLNSES